MKIASVIVSSYVGVSIGASHSYGDLIIDGRQEALVRPLTTGEANALNADAKAKGDKNNQYRKGLVSHRFLTEEDVLAEAEMQARAAGADVLFHGGYSDPVPVIYGPEPFKTLANNLAIEAELIGYYDRCYEQMAKISDDWLALLIK